MYSGNPILGPVWNSLRCPTATYYNGVFHLFVANDLAYTIERWTSTDGIHYVFAESIALPTASSTGTNPAIFKDPNSGTWYLYWHRVTMAGFAIIDVKSASSPTGFQASPISEVYNQTWPNQVAYPAITYFDGKYILLWESQYDNTYGAGVGWWTVNAAYSNSPVTGFVKFADSPVLHDNEACPTLVVDPTGEHLYLFTNRKISNTIWWQDVREVFADDVNALLRLGQAIRLSLGSLNIVVNTTAHLSDTFEIHVQTWADHVIWTSTSTYSNANITFTLSNLDSEVGYKVYVDGVLIYKQSKGPTSLSFTYSGPWSEHTFEVVAWQEAASGSEIQAAFSYVINGNMVYFTDKSYGEPVQWFWDFGDGYGSTAQNPTHTYARPGIYKVTLSVIDQNGATSTMTKTITIGQEASWLFGNTNTFIAIALLFVAFIILFVARRPAGVALALIFILISLGILIWS
jgi:hypothetical protein